MRVIIADAAIGLSPKSWLKDPQIKKYNLQKKRMPLMDGSKHQHLLKNLDKKKRLDRPDILHFGLLTILGYRKLIANLEVFFSVPPITYQVDILTRLPRSQSRFYGILEKLLAQETTSSFISPSELKIEEMSCIQFTKKGMSIVPSHFSDYENFVFGGFSSGGIRSKFPNAIKVKLSDQPLDLWTALSNFLNQYMVHGLKS